MTRQPPSDGGVDMAADYPPVKDSGAPRKKRAGRKKDPVSDNADGTVTITMPGRKPVTLTDKELKQVADKVSANGLTKAARERLCNFVSRIENLEEEKAEVAEQIKDVYGEAKSVGCDTKALRRVIRERKLDPHDRREQLDLFEIYWEVAGND
ncbi:MAG: DUF2312 domain-containing protein [Henriciella sp.]|nr:DUF2312 domain-containing protein [Henriciella sp.]